MEWNQQKEWKRKLTEEVGLTSAQANTILAKAMFNNGPGSNPKLKIESEVAKILSNAK